MQRKKERTIESSHSQQRSIMVGRPTMETQRYIFEGYSIDNHRQSSKKACIKLLIVTSVPKRGKPNACLVVHQ